MRTTTVMAASFSMAVITLLSALLLGKLGSASMEVSAPDTPIPVAIQAVILEDPAYTVHAAYPKVADMRDAAFEKVFNASAKRELQHRIDALASSAQTAYKVRDPSRPWFPHSLDARLQVYFNDGVLLCMSQRLDLYTGGVHGETDAVFYNILNTQPARVLTLPEIFINRKKGVELVNAAVRKGIAEQGLISESFRTVDEKTWFYITGKDLIVVFPEYAIGPHAAGVPEFKLPLSSLADILIPGIAR